MKTEKIVAKYGEALLRKENVVMVGKGRKIVRGVDMGNEALVVSVVKKVPLDQLAPKDKIPHKYKGMRTDVIETGEIRLLSAHGEDVDRMGKHRPAPGGVSIGHKDITAGTLGCVVHRNGQPLILSNNHVLANVNKGIIGDDILQPGKHDGGTLKDTIGTLYDYVPIKTGAPSDCKVARTVVWACNNIARLLGRTTRLFAMTDLGGNKVDCALALPITNESITDTILDIGLVSGVKEPTVGMPVRKSGRTTSLTIGKITQVSAMINVGMGDGKVAVFTDQIAMEHMSEPGDSGSLIVSEDNQHVGLLFAGSDKITIANTFSNVKAALRF